MRRDSAATRYKAQRGFTLFEMVAVICSIVILYMVAEQRLNDLPAAAERASFQAVLEQVKTGINFAMFSSLASSHSGATTVMEGTNPMAYLLETPFNYRGERSVVNDPVESRSSWYFETSTGQLVYVVGKSSIEDVLVTVAGTPVQLGQIRLRIASRYSAGPQVMSVSLPARSGRWQGVVLEPVHPYHWGKREDQTKHVEQGVISATQ